LFYTSVHQSYTSSLEHHAQITDRLADSLTTQFMQSEGANMPYPMALTALAQQILKADEAVYVQEPVLCSQKELNHGLQFFEKYGRICLFLLGHYALPYCYASAEGARVLYFSEKIRNNTRQRLIDTASFVLTMMHPKALADGSFNKAAAEIRMRHALVRYFIAQKGGLTQNTHPPINQHEMAGTNLAFSYLVIRGLHTLGLSADEKLEAGFLKLWNEIGLRLGVLPELLPEDMLRARTLEKTIRKQHFAPSTEGLGLLKSLLKVLEAEPLLPGVPPAEIIAFFMDKEVRGILRLPHDIPGTRKLWLKTALLAQHYFTKNTQPHGLFSIQKAFKSV
jgi:hypothetical protein